MKRIEWSNIAPLICNDVGTKKKKGRYHWVRLRHMDMVVPALLQFIGGEVSLVSTLEGFAIPTDPKFIDAWGPRFTYEDHVEGMSLAAAKDAIRIKREDGVDCPCCGQYVKIYKRKLNANMATFLASLVNIYEYTHEWVHYSKCKFRGRDYGHLTCWGLALTGKDATGKKRMTGLWKPTVKGIDFVHGTINVPTHVFLLDNEIQGFSSSTTFLADVDGFNFHELMRAR